MYYVNMIRLETVMYKGNSNYVPRHLANIGPNQKVIIRRPLEAKVGRGKKQKLEEIAMKMRVRGKKRYANLDFCIPAQGTRESRDRQTGKKRMKEGEEKVGLASNCARVRIQRAENKLDLFLHPSEYFHCWDGSMIN